MPMAPAKEIVPPSAEVRMLFAEQARLRRRTQRLANLGLLKPEAEPAAGADAAPDEKSRQLLTAQARLIKQVRRLAVAEETLSKLTEAFMEKYAMVDPLLLGLKPGRTDEPDEEAGGEGPRPDESLDSEDAGEDPGDADLFPDESDDDFSDPPEEGEATDDLERREKVSDRAGEEHTP